MVTTLVIADFNPKTKCEIIPLMDCCSIQILFLKKNYLSMSSNSSLQKEPTPDDDGTDILPSNCVAVRFEVNNDDVNIPFDRVVDHMLLPIADDVGPATYDYRVVILAKYFFAKIGKVFSEKAALSADIAILWKIESVVSLKE